MIKISKLADYAVVVLGALANKVAVASAADLSATTGMAVPTVAKVLKLLSKAGIVAGARGATGGYRLALTPDKLSIVQIITAIDGPVRVTECAEVEKRCAVGALCGMHGRWGPVNRALISTLSNITLADMLRAAPSPQSQQAA